MIQSYESRYLTVDEEQRADGTIATLEREPFRFREYDDTIVHVSSTGDTWWGLAQRYYPDISERPCGLWWVLCDFQPQPVVDPTLSIRPNVAIYVPSVLVVRNEILGVKREIDL